MLDRFSEVAHNDSHWRALENLDDFIRDQLAEVQSYNEAMSEQAKMQQKCIAHKLTLVDKTEIFTKLEKRQVGMQKSRQAKLEME